MKNKTILVISTNATRTGTPILLLNNLNWLKKNASFEYLIVLEKGGELLPEFEKIGKVYLWNKIVRNPKIDSKARPLAGMIERILNKIKTRLNIYFFTRYAKNNHDVRLIFSNSARNGNILNELFNRFKCKVLTYVHEGERILDVWNSNGMIKKVFELSDEIITVSEFVKGTLKDKYRVTKNIDVVPGTVKLLEKKDITPKLFQLLKLPTGAKVIMACGWLDWHKGVDQFVQLASLVVNKNPKCCFVWLGGNKNDHFYKNLMFDIDKMGLEDHVKIIESQNNSLEYMVEADLVLMLSREESFSLVTVEAGLLSKPVLCFDKVGGPCEIVGQDKRFIVPYMNLNAMSTRILELLDNETEYTAMGNYLNERVKQNYSEEICGKKLLAKINSLVA